VGRQGEPLHGDRGGLGRVVGVFYCGEIDLAGGASAYQFTEGVAADVSEGVGSLRRRTIVVVLRVLKLLLLLMGVQRRRSGLVEEVVLGTVLLLLRGGVRLQIGG